MEDDTVKKQIIAGTVSLVLVAGLLGGCGPTQSQGNDTLKEQNKQKVQQAGNLAQITPGPVLTSSLERQNISRRLVVSNDPNTLQWIYPMSAGRVIGRFPVQGKVTSGSKRLTSGQQITTYSNGNGGSTGVVTETPDEMGAYGSSGEYIFWFDPAGRPHQHKGDYFVSPVPYTIDKGYGTISVDIDTSEESKRNSYESQIKDSLAKAGKP